MVSSAPFLDQKWYKTTLRLLFSFILGCPLRTKHSIITLLPSGHRHDSSSKMEQKFHSHQGADLQTGQILAIAKFVESLQENCTYPAYDNNVAMSTAIKKLAVKFKELVEDNQHGWLGGGDALGKHWNMFFSASIRKLLRELPANNIQDISRSVEKLHREEAELKGTYHKTSIEMWDVGSARPREGGGKLLKFPLKDGYSRECMESFYTRYQDCCKINCSIHMADKARQ